MWFLSSTVGILACTVFIIEMDSATGKSLTELYVRHGSLHRQPLHLTEGNNRGSGRSNGSSIVNHRDQATNMTSIRHKRSRKNTMYYIPGTKLVNKVYCTYKIKLSTYNELNGVQMYSIECDGSIGKACQNKHCCVQTYEKVHVPTSYNSFEEVTIFTGCVCANVDIDRSVERPIFDA